MLLQYLQLLCGDAVRSSAFYRELLQIAEVKGVTDLREQPVQ